MAPADESSQEPVPRDEARPDVALPDVAPDPELVRAWQRMRAHRGSGGEVDAEALQQLVDPHVDDATREAALDRLLAQGHAPAIAMMQSLHDAAREAVAPAPTAFASAGASASARALRRWWPAPLAAAALALLMLRPSPPSAGTPTKAPTTRSGAAVVLLLRPEVDAPWRDSLTFSWRAVPDATGYTVRWMSGDGAILATQRVTTERTTFPADVPASARAQVVGWSVEASTPDGRTLRSELRSLRAR